MEEQVTSAIQSEVDLQPQPLIRAGWLRALIYLILCFGFVVAMGLVAYLGFDIKSSEDFVLHIDSPKMLLLNLLQLGLLLLITAAACRFFDRRPLVAIGFSLRAPFAKHLLWGFAWGVAIITVVFLILLVTGSVTVVSAQFPIGSFVVMIPVLILAAAFEEIMLRGYMLNNLMASMNKYLALILVSLLFSVSHLGNPNQTWAGLFNIILAGLLLGTYYIHVKNLWFPIALHFAWNFFQGGIYGSPVSGLTTPSVLTLNFPGSEILTGGQFGFEASWVTTFVLAAVIIGHHLIFRGRQG
jgi:membrane protease YdiL (CAAX protease family)